MPPGNRFPKNSKPRVKLDLSAFESHVLEKATRVDTALKLWSSSFLKAEKSTAIGHLAEAASYALLGGGKRFRPVLSLMVGEALGSSSEGLLRWAAAIEMIHTYSLIHDDLPCMDDDDERRGRPTVHKVYGEATALLAGDALLTEAFDLAVQANPSRSSKLIPLLVRCAGLRGMVGGQALDLAAEKGGSISQEALFRIHQLKTGCLIRAATEGAAIVSDAPEEKVIAFRIYGEKLGLAFQIADDLLDAEKDGEDGRSFLSHFGHDGTRQQLKAASLEAREALKDFIEEPSPLFEMIDWNLERKK